MDASSNGFVKALLDRLTGPLHFRMFFQPLMAAVFGVRDGLRDAREGKPPYFWSIFTNPLGSGEFLRHGLKSVWKILILAAVLDMVYQFIALHSIHLGHTFFIAILLAFVPYLIIRGPANRIARRWRER
jgi:hypothetical protein